MSDAPSRPLFRDRALGILAAGTILAILYFGREVLVPITLAETLPNADRSASSLVEALQICLDWVEERGAA